MAMRTRSLKSSLCLLLLVILVLALPGVNPLKVRSQPAPVIFYVALSGNDTWSGKLAEANAARTDGPFATLQRARDAIRQLKREQGGTLRQPVTVFIRGGTYYLREPLMLIPEDSGTAESPVTYAAFQGERPVISGGKVITGWRTVTVGGRQMWAAEIPEVREGKWFFRQLWVNGQRRVRARHPNTGLLRIARLLDVASDTTHMQGQNRFEFTSGDIRAWANLEDVEVVMLHMWAAERLPIAGVDEQGRVVTFDRKTQLRMTESSFDLVPAQYYVEHALELLDVPGEWYLSRRTGTVYYLPMPGESVQSAEIVAPALMQLVQLQGVPTRTDRFVEHLIFRGLTLVHNDWQLLPRENQFQTAIWQLPGVIFGEGIRGVAFEGLTIAHVGTYAINLRRAIATTKIVGCELFDLGAGGIVLGPTFYDTAGQPSQMNEITDCHIHDGGIVFHHGIPLWMSQNQRSRVAHNHVHDFGFGISLTGTFQYGPSLARQNVAEFNNVHHIGIRANGDPPVLSDTGGIYTVGESPGTVIRFNLVHDVATVRYGAEGIYFDEGTSGVLAESNIVYNIGTSGFYQHYGKENVVRNNIFAFARGSQVRGLRPESHLSSTFERNIVYWREGDAAGGRLRDLRVSFDRNLYWREGAGALRFSGLSWEEWQGRGMDRNSLIADPLFLAADRGDFRLKSESPAFRLGFQPIDLSRVGPRPEVLEEIRRK